MIYQISSGQGPAECERAVALFLRFLQDNYEISVIDFSAGYNKEDYCSVRLYTDDNLDDFTGSVQWICKSPYRPHHERKNWFIDFQPVSVSFSEEFDEGQVIYETFRSGGRGGQHVNKTETGVRAIYIPSGNSAVSTEERSQHLNKRKALERLRENFKKQQQQKEADTKNSAWQKHTEIVRGSAVTKFKGSNFVRIK